MAVTFGSSASIFVFALAALTLAQTASAHAGHFHLCPDTPSGRNYVRYEIGNCTTFTTLNTTANLTMTGKVTLWVYAYKNCSDSLSSALEFNTMVYSNGVPLTKTNTTGYGSTGTCAAASKAIYYNNATLGNDPTNSIFWYPTLTSDNGSICGNAANSFVVRAMGANGQLDSNPLQSFVLSTADAGPALCCDLGLYPKPALTDITSQTAPCNVAPPSPPTVSQPPPRRPPPSSGAAASLRMSLSALLGAAMLIVMVMSA